MERVYGYRYTEAEGSAAEIAKRIRGDIKTAVRDGLLRSEATYSVTSESFSGGQAINIRVKGWTEAWTVCDGGQKCRNVWCSARNDPQYAHAATPHYVLTEEAEAAKMTLERIHNAYNHDGSDSMVDYFDVRYYGHVEFEDAASEAFWAKEKARKEARRQAIDEAAKAGTRSLKLYKRDGTSTIHLAAEVEGRLMLVCGAMLRRGTLTGATDQEPTCSRCQKRAGR